MNHARHRIEYSSPRRPRRRSLATKLLVPLACLSILLTACRNDPQEQDIGSMESVEPTQRQDIDLSRAAQDQTLLVITVRMQWENGLGELHGCPDPVDSATVWRSALFQAVTVPPPERTAGGATPFSGIALLPPPAGVGCGNGSHSAVCRLRVTDVAALAAQPPGDFELVMRPRFGVYYTFASRRPDAGLLAADGDLCLRGPGQRRRSRRVRRPLRRRCLAGAGDALKGERQ